MKEQNKRAEDEDERELDDEQAMPLPERDAMSIVRDPTQLVVGPPVSSNDIQPPPEPPAKIDG